MTISSTTRKAGPFVGNDSTTDLPFSFKVFSSDNVKVVLSNPFGVESVLSLLTHYTIEINENQNSAPGGVVKLLTPLMRGYRAVVSSKVPTLQPIDLTNQGGFYPQVITNALDRLTILIQQLEEELSRTFKVPITSTDSAGNSVVDYLSQASASADSALSSADAALSSAQTASSFSVLGGVYAAQAEASASAAESAAESAIVPTATALSLYLDRFFPVSQIVLFTSIYQVGGCDFGTVVQSSPFSNETATRRASLSMGSASIDFGALT